MENGIIDANQEMKEVQIQPAVSYPVQQETNDKTDELLRIMKKQLLASRINACMLAGILIAALVFGIIIAPGMIKTITLANKSLTMVNEQVIPMIESVNIDNLNGAVSELKTAVADLDVDSMNGAVTELQNAIKKIDIKDLNEAIAALNATLQPLAHFFGGTS